MGEFQEKNFFWRWGGVSPSETQGLVLDLRSEIKEQSLR